MKQLISRIPGLFLTLVATPWNCHQSLIAVAIRGWVMRVLLTI